MSNVADVAENGKSGFDLINAIRKLRGLRKTERLLFLELAFHKNNQTGQCNPGYACLAEDLELSVSSVRRTIRALEEKGLIRKTPGFAKVSSKYAFTLPAEAFKEEKGSVTSEPPRVSPEGGGGVVTSDQREWSLATRGSGHQRPEGVVTSDHQTVLELQKELQKEEREQRTLSKPSFHDSKRQKARPENPAAIQAFMESEGMSPMQAIKESETMFHYYESKGWKGIVDWQSSAKVWMLRARPEPGGPKTLQQTGQEMAVQWDRLQDVLSVGDEEAASRGQHYDVTSPAGNKPRTRQVGEILENEDYEDQAERDALLWEQDQIRYEEAKAGRKSA